MVGVAAHTETCFAFAAVTRDELVYCLLNNRDVASADRGVGEELLDSVEADGSPDVSRRRREAGEKDSDTGILDCLLRCHRAALGHTAGSNLDSSHRLTAPSGEHTRQCRFRDTYRLV